MSSRSALSTSAGFRVVASVSVVEFETPALDARVGRPMTDETQGWSAALLTEFGEISGDGSVAELSPRGLGRLL
jgi:hypothetical protein